MSASRPLARPAAPLGPAVGPSAQAALPVGRHPGALAAAGRLGERTARRARRHAEDVVLVEAVRGGDSEAFGQIVERYQRRVFWLAHDILLDADEARDVAQETFLRLHASLDRYDTKRDFVNWLYRIARNLSIDLLRRRRRRALLVEDVEASAPTPEVRGLDEAEAEASSTEVSRRVHETLATLPVDYRMALTLRDLHGMTPREIAAITDCSYPTARWRIHRARALFREAWEARHGTTDGHPGEHGA